MFKKIDHIGIAVYSVEAVKKFFYRVFGLSPVFEEIVQEQQVKIVGFRVGESNLEFLEPTSDRSSIAKYLEKRGEGLHHVSVGVENIKNVIESLKSAKIQLIDDNPRIGAEGKKIAFVHPKGIFGVLLELSEKIDNTNHSSNT